MTTDELALASEFPTPDAGQWRAAVDKILDRSGDLDAEALERRFQKTLVTRLHDGFEVQPLYTRDDLPAADPGLPGSAPFVRGATAAGGVADGWDVRQPVLVDPADAATTNRTVLDELEHGATSLLLRLPAGAGLDADGLDAALAGVYLDAVAISLDDEGALAGALVELWARQGHTDAASGCLGLDPVGRRASDPAADVAASLDAAWPIVEACLDRHPNVRPLAIDGRRVHEAGGSDVDELGAVIATGVETVRLLADRGVAPERAFGLLEFRLASTADQFSTIAKLRAARRLWARVAAEVGVDGPAGAMRQHALMGRAMLTRYDPWVNLLRGTVACMAAGVGGADAVTVEAYDALHHDGAASALGRRMARNTQSILVEESHLARVLDPGGGSYYVESLTDTLARAAWAWFQEIEAAGGMVAAVEAGSVADRVAATWAARTEAIGHRHDPITGVSEFPNVAEEIPLTGGADPTAPTTSVDGALPRHRYAEPFEALRARCDRHAADHARPVVLLAEIGTPAETTARSTFAKNFYEAAGFRTVAVPAGAGAVDGLAGAVAEHAPALACLCSTDAAYTDGASPVIEALRTAGVAAVHLAGRAPDGVAVDQTISLGCDALGILRQAVDQAGVA